MKKIILSIIGAMLISLGGVYAQQEEPSGAASKSKSRQQRENSDQARQQTDRSRQQTDQARQQGDRTDGNQSWQQQTDRNQYGDSYANSGMVMIEKEQIPASLKKTLKDQKYAGWENATIYHNTTTGEYVIAPRAYRFDSNGKEMEMSDADRTGYGQGRTGRYAPGNRDGQYSNDPAGQQSQNRSSEYNRQRQNGDQSTTEDQSATSDQSTNQPSQNQSPQDQTDNTSTTPRNQQPSSGYRSGQDTRTNDEDSNATQNNTSTQTESGQTDRDQ